MSRIDAHHHVWHLGHRDQPWIDPVSMSAIRRDFPITELEPRARAEGVSRTIIVQTVSDPAETPEMLALAEDSELVAAVVGWTDLTAESVADDLARLRTHRGGDHLVGIRHQVQDEPDPDWLNRPDVRRGLRAVGAAGLIYELLVLPKQLDAAIATVRALPEVTFVLDHIAKPPIASGERQPWAERMRTLAAESNVYCKLSGMVTEADWSTWTAESIRPYADVVLDAFGPSRLMFGSDWPVCLLAADYPGVVRLAETLIDGLDPDAQAEVFTHTAERVYELR